MPFQPDHNFMVQVLHNQRPARLPLYEHIISPEIMEQILGLRFAELLGGNETDVKEFFTHFCRFFKDMTYDTVSFEVCITDILPDHGAIKGGRPGPIQNRQDFEAYPWADIPRLFWNVADRQFRLLGDCLPEGMKAIGGVGNGVLEISEDLVGYQYLAYMMIDDPDLFADLYRKIGDLMVEIWEAFLRRHVKQYAICRFGDDLGFKTSTLLAPKTISTHIIPQYKRVIDVIHRDDRPFLWHSCGKIFPVMDEMIKIGIDAKHSNEDAIAPYDTWIDCYGERIGLLGGVDMGMLCQTPPDEIFARVVEMGQRFRHKAKGYALGSGNSIPEYVPVEGYLAMVKAAQYIREQEKRVSLA